nr:hypothetical protein [Stenotrophomonas pavanii]
MSVNIDAIEQQRPAGARREADRAGVIPTCVDTAPSHLNVSDDIESLAGTPVGQVDVHILQQQLSSTGQHTACTCTCPVDLNRTQVHVGPVLQPCAVAVTVHVDADMLRRQAATAHFQTIGLATLDLDDGTFHIGRPPLHEDTMRQATLRGDADAIQDQLAAQGLCPIRHPAFGLDARVDHLDMPAIGGRDPRRTRACRQYAALLQRNLAARILRPRRGGAHAVRTKIDRTGWNNGASIECVEGIASRVARLHRLGRGIVAGRRRLFVTVGDDLLCVRGGSGSEYGCQRQCQGIVAGEVVVHGMSLGNCLTCSVSAALSDIE